MKKIFLTFILFMFYFSNSYALDGVCPPFYHYDANINKCVFSIQFKPNSFNKALIKSMSVYNCPYNGEFNTKFHICIIKPWKHCPNGLVEDNNTKSCIVVRQ